MVPYDGGEERVSEVNSSVSSSTVARVYSDSLGSERRGFMVDAVWDEAGIIIYLFS